MLEPDPTIRKLRFEYHAMLEYVQNNLTRNKTESIDSIDQEEY